MSNANAAEEFEKYRLTVGTHNGSTLQLVSDAVSGNNTWQRWQRKRKLGHGAFGEVWQEAWEDTDGDFHYRAVKICSERNMQAAQIDYKRELSALAAFSKSENILVFQKRPEFRRWWVKIADFGISKQVFADSETELRTVVGTRPYCAPEILGYLEQDQDTFVYTSKVDMWSFGCVLFNLGSRGQLPFSVIDLARYCDGKVQFNPRNHSIYLSHGCKVLVRALLRVRPEQRPSATEALRDLWFSTRPLQAPEGSTQTPPGGTQVSGPQNPNSILNSTLSTSIPPTSKESSLTLKSASITAQRSAAIPNQSLSAESSSRHLDLAQHLVADLGGERNSISSQTSSQNQELAHKDAHTQSSPVEAGSKMGVESLKSRGMQDFEELSQRSEPSDINKWMAENARKIRNEENVGGTALHVAADEAHLRILKSLVERGAKVDQRNKPGFTPLLRAASCGRPEIVKWLAENGAALNVRDNFGMNALHIAAPTGQLNLLEWLEGKEFDIHAICNRGWTPLHYAANAGSLEAAKWLIKHGAHKNVATDLGQTPLHLAASRGHLSTVQLLVKHGTEVTGNWKLEKTPRQLAERHGKTEVALWLIEQEIAQTAQRPRERFK